MRSSRHPPHIGAEDYVNSDAEGRMTAAQRSHLRYHSPTKQPGKAVTSNLLEPEDYLCKICFLSQTAHLKDHSKTYYEKIILRLFHLGISCTVFVFNCFVICGCFSKMYTCIYCVLYRLYCVFCIVSFMYIYSYLFCLY